MNGIIKNRTALLNHRSLLNLSQHNSEYLYFAYYETNPAPKIEML